MKKCPTLAGLLEAGNLLLLLISIVSIFDSLSRYLELLSHFKSQYLCGSLIFILIFLVLKNVRGISVAAISLVINGAFVLPLYFSESHSATPVNQVEVKVLLSNVYTGNQEYKKLIDLVERESPDILVLQEVDSLWLKNIEVLFEQYAYRLIKPRSDNFGIAVLSKTPTIDQKVTHWGNADIPSVESYYQIDGKTFYLFATHPLPPISEIHYELRNAQLSELAARAEEVQDAKLIVGDLNTTLWSSDYKKLTNKTKMHNAREGFGILPTWPAWFPLLSIPIDHILISKEFRVKSIKTGPDIGSDHLPLIVVLDF